MRLNWLILICVFLLVIFGILAIWSSVPSPQVSEDVRIDSVKAGLRYLFKYHYIKQILFALVSLVILVFIIFFINYYRLKDYAFLIFGIVFLSLILLIVWGKVRQGAQRWFAIGPFTIQPSEFMKIALVLALARLMMFKKNISSFTDYLPPIILTTLSITVVLLQPSLGIALIFLPTFLVMLLVAGAKMRHLVLILGLLIILLPVGYFMILKDYQRARLTAFLDPTKSPTTEGFQLIQSRIAIGSGGLIGRGWGRSEADPELFVPERHNDFIFTVIAEEWGFLGSVFIILLYMLIFISGLSIAYSTREPFGRLITVGLVSYLAVQTYINIGMTMGLAPITGITLPFVSYGGSSLVSSFIAIGLVLNVGRHRLPSFASRDFE